MLTNKSIDKIGIFVSDFNRSLFFFKNILMLNPIWESKESKNAGFRAGFNLLIMQEDVSQTSSGGIRIYFTVNEISLIRNKMLEANILCSSIKDFGDFKLMDFSDYDGNKFGLMEPSKNYIPTLEQFLRRKIFFNS